MKILITSGGQLATLLYHALKDRHDVRVMRRRPDPVFGDACIIGDVSSYDDVARAMEGRQCVFHTAVRNNTDVELKSYEEFLSANVDGSFNVFLAATRLGTPRIVASSTSMVNGFHAYEADMTPGQGAAICLDDDAPPRNADIYCLTKNLAETSADYFRAQHNLSIISLRYGWLAPPQQYRDPAMIYNTLQFCFHEQDALAANLLAMDQPVTGNYLITGPSVFTDGDREDLWQRPEKVLEKYYPQELDYLHSIDFKPTPIAVWLDSTRAMRDLGYEPKYDFKRFVAMHREGAFG